MSSEAVFAVPADFAAPIDRARDEGEERVPHPPLAPQPRGDDAPLSLGQERVWVLQRLAPHSPAYGIPVTLRISGPLHAGALERATGEIVRRHQALRTVIVHADGVPAQRVLPFDGFRLPLHDLTAMPPDAREEGARRLISEDRRTPFGMDGAPLFRAFLVRVAADDHLLHANAHHAVFDGESAAVFQRELWALYAAYSRGEASPLPELAVQYADFAIWQRGWMDDDAAKREVGWWRETLAGAPPLLELPTDRPRPAAHSHRAAVTGALLPAQVLDGLRTLARREGATPFMVLLAALDVVLARWSGQDDVVVGTQVAGRTHAATEPMLGLFVNTLALRVSLAQYPTFGALLARVREATLAAYAHQQVPFERVVQALGVPRSLAHAPVFQVQLGYLDADADPPRLPDGLSAELYSAGDPGARLDLTLHASESPDGLAITAVYAADLFTPERIAELVEQVAGVLRQAVADPRAEVGALSLRTDAAAAVLPDPARTMEAEAWTGALHARVAERAAEAPDAVAVQDARERWTYAELDAAANRIAHRLVADGVRPGDTVAVWAHRSAPLVRALLAAWKAGAAFVSLDPAYPPARLAEYVRIARPSALLRIGAGGEVPPEVAQALGATVKSTVVLAAKGKDGAEDQPAQAPPVDVGPDDLAYVAFTSGTTGTPKAVAGTHRPLAHFFGWYGREMGVGAKDRFTLLAGLAHDPLLRDVFAPLSVGAAIVIPDPEGLVTPGWLAEWMGRERITVAHLTPATMQLTAAGAEDVTLPALRLACFGGDLLRAADVRTLRSISPGARAVNFYGATETPQAMGAYAVPDDLSAERETLPVGRGIDGVDLLVINGAGKVAGIGEVGEIVIRTPYLSRGYLNDAELTAARFVANPWTGHAADRMYHTGDLGRYRPDGAVEIAGRADAQMKVRGFRVEAGEVEAALRSHPSVREAVALAAGAGDDRRLVAYLVAEGEPPRAVAIRGHLRKLLPGYMVPSSFVWLDALPLTPNGKVDRRALPDPDAPVQAAPVAPRTAAEEVIAGIWAGVLGVESVGVEDDFFALGGHSLGAAQVLARIARQLRVRIPLRAMFETPTVAGLAAHAQAAGGGAPAGVD
jgi:amino acid adenylation domain-containing protein